MMSRMSMSWLCLALLAAGASGFGLAPATPRRAAVAMMSTPDDAATTTLAPRLYATCTKCAASYVLEAAALGDAGATVKCAVCANEWHQTADALSR